MKFISTICKYKIYYKKMKKTAGYSLLNKKNKKSTGQNLIQDEEQIQMQEISAKNFLDQPSYAHLQDYNQDLEQDKLYKAFDDQKPMKKHSGKLPPLQNAYKAEEKPKMQAYTSNVNVRDDPRNGNYNSNPSYFQNQTPQPNSYQNQNANMNLNAQKIKQQNHQQKLNESVLSSNLNQSTYYNPYQTRPNMNTTVIYQNQNPSVIPASYSCYMNRGPNSIIVNPNPNSILIQQQPQQQPKPSIPMMLVACKYCTLQQNVPSNTKVFKCWGCRNNNQCEPQYGSFICYNCHKKIGYQYGVSELIRCSVCTSVNQVSKFNQKSVSGGNVLNNPQKLSQREELQFKQDKKLLGKYDGKKPQADEIIDDIEDDEIVMVEHDGYRY